ncbi:MAG: D-alanyl-D-alanine carboxypeptidase [Bacilli bacterium]|nr:D-alanyl-D-alanine carboxypeptidase [Bacilli bacterium]
MKKIIFILLLSILLNPIYIFAEEKQEEQKEEIALIKNATSGLLMEESTGQIIYEKDKDKQVAVASMTKMVAQIIILENIESKKIKWTDVVTVSKNAADMGGSQIYLAANEKMTVKDLFKGISMASANDATVAMAEHISGSENKFVQLMNQKVKELGLKNTAFKNSTGLDEEGHFSSAYDMAIIAKNLLSHEEILNFSGVYEDYLRVNTPNKFWLVNTNKLVRTYSGSDGLKTGHTDAAKYCIAATAKRNNMRLIAIVLGEDTAAIRNKEAMELLDYGFNNKQLKIIKKKNEIIKTLTLDKSTRNSISIKPEKDITILTDKGVNNNKYSTKLNINKIKLPLKKNQVVGSITVYQDNKKIVTKNLIVTSSVEKLSYLKLLLNNLKNISTGIL